MAERTNPHADIIVGAQDQATPVFDKIKGSAAGMAQGVEQSATKAGQAVGKIGDNAIPAAGKVDNATKSIIGSIERATAAMKAGERGTASYFEALAKQRNVSADAIKPYVDELRRAEAAQQAAVAGQQSLGMSAKQTAAALRGVPAQITDIVVSLQGGQRPMTVLLQQGGQLKDMFGGIVPAARALGTSILGMLNPLSLVTVGVATLGAAYYQGSKEADEYTRAILLSGNAAGTTASEMSRMAANISRSVGTQAAAAEVLSQMASTGRIASTDLERFATTAVRMERDVGVAIKQTVAEFEELGKAPVEASRKLGDQYGYLTAAIYSQIKALDEQGRATDAARLAQETYDQAMSRVADGMVQRLGYLERGWRAVRDGAKGAWDAMLNIGRPDTMADEIGKVRAKIEALQKEREMTSPNMRGGIDEGIEKLKQRLGIMESDERQLRRNTEAQAARTAADKAAREAMDAVDKLTESSYTKQEKLNKALADYRKSLDKIRAVSPDDKRLDPANIAKVEANIREQYTDKSSAKAAQSAQSEIAAIQAKIKLEEDYIARLQERGTVAEKANEGERLAAKLNEELAGKLDAKTRAEKESLLVAAQRLGEVQRARSEEERQAKALEESEKAFRKFLDSLQKSSDAVGLQADQQEAANATFGKGKTAIEELTLAQMKLAAASAKDAGPWSPEMLAKMEEGVRQQERYVAALKAADFAKATRAFDEQIPVAREQHKLTMEELSLIGLTEVERRKIIAAREIELDLAKELRDIDKMTLEDEDDRAILYQQAREKARIRTENAIARETLNEWQRTADEINRSLTDALLRGFESGKGFAENFRDTLKNMFNTLVLRPIISAVMQPVSMLVNGAVQGGLSALGGGSSLMGMAGNASSLYSLMSGNSFINTVGGWLGLGGASSMYALGTGATGLGLTAGGGLGLTAGGGLGLTAGTGAAGAAGSGFMGSLSAIPGWGWALAGIGLLGGLLSGLDDSGTPHMGGAAAWSRGQGLRTNLDFLDDQEGLPGYNPNDNIDNQFGSGMPWVQDNEQVRGTLGMMAQTFASTLDTFAKTFGQQAGYDVALGFADDSSKDGSWGALRVALGDRELLNWNDDRESKWAPRIFSDGEQGWKEFTAATAQDMRDVMTDMDIPGWVRESLEDLGDSFDLDALGAVVTQIGAVNTAFDALGFGVAAFADMTDEARARFIDAAGGLPGAAATAGNYYDKFYSDDEKQAFREDALSQEMERLGLAIPATREGFRELVEAQIRLGESGAETAARLMGLSDAAYEVLPAADEATGALRTMADAAKESFGITADTVKGLLDSILEDATSAAQARNLGETGFQDMVVSSIFDSLVGNMAGLVMAQIVAPLIAGATTSGAVLAAGGATGGAAVAGGGVMGGSASAAGGSVAGQAIAQGGAAAANAMIAGGSAVGAVVGDVLEAARAQMQAVSGLLQDPAFMEMLGELGQGFGNLSADLFNLKGSFGGGITSVSGSFDSAGKSADGLSDALSNLTGTIEDEIKRLRGIMEDASPNKGYDALMADFVTTTAAARAGDEDALAKLPGLSKEIEALLPNRATSSSELAQMRGWFAGSLSETLKGIADAKAAKAAAEEEERRRRSRLSVDGAAWIRAGRPDSWNAAILEEFLLGELNNKKTSNVGYGLIPGLATGTNYVPEDMLAVIHKGEAVVPKEYNPAAGGQQIVVPQTFAQPFMGGESEVVAELRELRHEVAQLREQNEALALDAQRLRLRQARTQERTEGLIAMQEEKAGA